MKPTFVQLPKDSFWVEQYKNGLVNLQGIRAFQTYDQFELDRVHNEDVWPGHSHYGLRFYWKHNLTIAFEWNRRAVRDEAYKLCVEALDPPPPAEGEG